MSLSEACKEKNRKVYFKGKNDECIFCFLQVCVTFVFGALLEYALVNYASRSDAQRLAKKKVQKQWEIDHCSFDPSHMEDALPNNGGGSFAMVRHKRPIMKNFWVFYMFLEMNAFVSREIHSLLKKSCKLLFCIF